MIWLVRHGETEFNREHRLQGRIDSALTELGLDQAAQVGRWFAARTPSPGGWTVVASPLGRSMATAQIIAGACGLDGPISADPRLTELSIGAWEGRTRTELEVLHPELAGQPFFMPPCRR